MEAHSQSIDEIFSICARLQIALNEHEVFISSNHDEIIKIARTTTDTKQNTHDVDVETQHDYDDDEKEEEKDGDDGDDDTAVVHDDPFLRYLQQSSEYVNCSDLVLDHDISADSELDESLEDKDVNDGDNIHNTDKVELELLVIGSSIMRDIDATKIEKRSPTKARTICIPGAKIETIMMKITELNETHNIKQIIIHGGGNNIKRDIVQNPRKLTSQITTMLQHTQHIMPDTKIHYSAVLPRTDNKLFPGIISVNRAVREYCKSHQVKFIPNYEFFRYRNINGQYHYQMDERLIRVDKVHPTHVGTSVIAKNFISSYRNYRRTKF